MPEALALPTNNITVTLGMREVKKKRIKKFNEFIWEDGAIQVKRWTEKISRWSSMWHDLTVECSLTRKNRSGRKQKAVTRCRAILSPHPMELSSLRDTQRSLHQLLSSKLFLIAFLLLLLLILLLLWCYRIYQGFMVMGTLVKVTPFWSFPILNPDPSSTHPSVRPPACWLG